MSDFIPKPSVVSDVKIGNFTLYVYAYRKITPTEAKESARTFLKKSKFKKFPKNGSGKIVTTYGLLE